MRHFRLFLTVTGIAFVAAGTLHILLGVEADALLGVELSAASRIDAGLDSQNRFYGAMFAVCGALLICFARDTERYAPPLVLLLGGFAIAGLVRLVSVVQFGWPPALVMALGAIEVALPPVLLFWFSRLRA